MTGVRAQPGLRSGMHIPCLYLSALTLLVLPLQACSNSPAQSAQSSPISVTLSVGLPVQTGADPLHGANQAARLLSFEGLSYLERDGRPQPRLAEAWSESPDGRNWTIRLRSNAYFHDGTRVDASAVRASLERSLGTADRDLSPGLADIVGIETPSQHEVRIQLREKSTFLLDDLAVAITKRDSNGRAVGTGPFVTASTSEGELVMTAVSNYYRGKPVIDRVVLKSYPAVRTAWAAMMRGDVDFLYEVSPDALEFIQSEATIEVFPFLRNYVYGVVFNSRDDPLRKVEVRRALNFAVDRSTLVERALKGRGVAANGPAWPLHWAYDTSVTQYAFDPSRAAAMLDAAGISRNLVTSTNNQAPARLHFTCLVPENFALWERMALMVQRDLSRIGVDMKIEQVQFSVFNKRIAEGDFDAVMLEMIAGNSISRPYFFWHSKSRMNTWGYQNTAVDNALDSIRRASDDAMYRAAFREFQLAHVEDPPAIFLALSNVTRAVNKYRFQVVAPSSTDILPSISEWQLGQELTRAAN
jgi:peptide/nickel transport system substrate-binding protein